MTTEKLNETFMRAIVDAIQTTWGPIQEAIRGQPISEIHFFVKGETLDSVIAHWLNDYDPGSIMVEISAKRQDLPHMGGYNPMAAPGFFDTDDVTFYLYDEPVSLDLGSDGELVDDDTKLPLLIEILREAIAQGTAKPVIDLGEYNENAKKEIEEDTP